MNYKILIRKLALKELEELPTKTNRQLVKAIDDLSINPSPVGCKKLKGKTNQIWRIRVGDYRILYVIEDKIKIVEIRKIGHRKEIYD